MVGGMNEALLSAFNPETHSNRRWTPHLHPEWNRIPYMMHYYGIIGNGVPCGTHTMFCGSSECNALAL